MIASKKLDLLLPIGLVVFASGTCAAGNGYVANTYANSVSVLNLKDGKVIATVRVGKGPNGI